MPKFDGQFQHTWFYVNNAKHVKAKTYDQDALILVMVLKNTFLKYSYIEKSKWYKMSLMLKNQRNIKQTNISRGVSSPLPNGQKFAPPNFLSLCLLKIADNLPF